MVQPKLTIVVPSYRRHEYALRQMRFWSQKNVILHVLDGSNSPIEKDQLDEFGDNINYHHMPVSLMERFQAASGLITTDYVAFLGDDDIFVPSALNTCVDRLENDPTYVSCIGRTLFFNFVENDFPTQLIYQDMRHRDLNQADARSRMLAHMNPYAASTFYSVARVDAWKNAARIAFSHTYKCSYTIELLFELAMSLQGKSKTIETLSWLRSNENKPLQDTSFDRKLHFHTWYKDPQYAEDVKKFLENSSKEMASVGNIDQSEARNLLLDSLDKYMQNAVATKKRNIFQKVWRLIFPPVEKWSTRESDFETLRQQNVEFHSDEMDHIFNMVKAFHKNRKKEV